MVYEDAEHVMIYQKYPQDYLKHIREHLIACGLQLNNNNNKTDLIISKL